MHKRINSFRIYGWRFITSLPHVLKRSKTFFCHPLCAISWFRKSCQSSDTCLTSLQELSLLSRWQLSTTIWRMVQWCVDRADPLQQLVSISPSTLHSSAHTTSTQDTDTPLTLLYTLNLGAASYLNLCNATHADSMINISLV